MARVIALLRSPLHTTLSPKTLQPTSTTWRSKAIALIPTLLLSGLLTLTLPGCANRTPAIRVVDLPDLPSTKETRRLSGDIREVAPPAVFIDLEALMEGDQPRVEITYPKADQIIDDTQINVKLKLRGLSIYKDEDIALGPHLQIILDNQPARAIYSLKEDITFQAIAPGSHTLRVLAVRPWGESFKNADAYAQTTFHVFAKTGENTPNPNKPLLTYNQPQDTYGAEPVLLDFYLTNAPLHQIAQESSKDDITDWKIQCSVNGQRFVFDQWEPIYLKGLKPGQNWIQLTLIDEQGQPIDNAFNNTVRTLTYDPDQRESLDKIVRGELPLSQIGQIADPSYTPPIEPTAPVADKPEEIIEPEPTEPEPTEPEPTEPEPVKSETTDSPQEKEILLQQDENTEPNNVEQPEPEEQPLNDEETVVIENEGQGEKEIDETPTDDSTLPIETLETDNSLEPEENSELPEKPEEQPDTDPEVANPLIEATEEKATDSIADTAEASGSSLWQQLRQRVQSTWQNIQPEAEDLSAPIESEPIESEPAESESIKSESADTDPPEIDLPELAPFQTNLPETNLPKTNLPEDTAQTAIETQKESEPTAETTRSPNTALPDSDNGSEELGSTEASENLDKINELTPLEPLEKEPLGKEPLEEEPLEEELLEEIEIPEPIAIPDRLKTPEIPTENLLLPRTEALTE